MLNPPTFQNYYRNNGNYYVYYPDINMQTGLMNKSSAKKLSKCFKGSVVKRIPTKNIWDKILSFFGG